MGKWKNEMQELIMDISSPKEINSHRKRSTPEKMVFSIDELSEKLDAYINESDYYSAIKYCTDIVSRAPSWVPAWNLLGHVYRAAGNVQYAYDAYHIGALRSGREQNWYELGDFCMGSSLYIEACRAYINVLVKNPHNFGSYKKIHYIFEKYINKFGSITLGMDMKSRLFELEDDMLEKLVDSIHISRESRDNKFKPEILCSVGMIFEARGHRDDACSCYKAAGEIEKDRSAKGRLAIFLLGKGLIDEAYSIFSEINMVDSRDNIAKVGAEMLGSIKRGKDISREIFDILKWYPSSPTINDYVDLKNKFAETEEYERGVEVFYWLDRFYTSDIALCRCYASLLELAGMTEEAYHVTNKILMIKASPNTITIAVLFCIRNNMLERAENLRRRYSKKITKEAETIIDNVIYLHKKADKDERDILSELTLVIRANVIEDLHNFMVKYADEDYIKNDRIIKIIRTRFSINSENTTDKLRICLFKVAVNTISNGHWESEVDIRELLKSYDEDIYMLSEHINDLITEGYIDAFKISKIMKLLLQGKLSEYANIIGSAYWKENRNVFNTVVVMMSALFNREDVAASIYQLLRKNMSLERKIEILNKCLEVCPTPDYYEKLIFNYIANRQWDLAVSNINRLIKDFPDSREACNSEKCLCWCDMLMEIELGEINFGKYKHGKLASALHYLVHRFEGAEEYVPRLIDICRKQNNIVILNTIKGLMRVKTENMEINACIG